MTIRHALSRYAVLLTLTLCPLAQAYDFRDDRATALSRLIQASLAAQTAVSPSAAAEVDEINQAFTALPRETLAVEDLRELKYELQSWRVATADYLVKKAGATPAVDEFLDAVTQLDHLHLYIGETAVDTVLKNPLVSGPGRDGVAAETAANLAADQGLAKTLLTLPGGIPAGARLRAGPQLQPGIQPIKASKWPFSRWSRRADLADYEFKDGGVLYRGLLLRPGDLFLINLSEPTDGLYTSMGEPRSYLSHFALFVILEKDGRRFPAAIEIHEHGVRAVPLSTYLAPAFSTYLEVYRFRNAPAAWEAGVSREALKILGEVHAYDFYSQDTNRRYLTCTTVGSLFFERFGITPPAAKTRILEGTRRNLARLDLSMDLLLTPTDLAVDPALAYVGALDNGGLAMNVTRNLVVAAVTELFSTREIELSRLPRAFYVNRWGIRQIQHGTPVGALFRRMNGFTANTFPNGPAGMMALVPVLEKEVEKAVELSRDEIAQAIAGRGLLSMHELEENPEIRAAVRAHLGLLPGWFSAGR